MNKLQIHYIYNAIFIYKKKKEDVHEYFYNKYFYAETIPVKLDNIIHNINKMVLHSMGNIIHKMNSIFKNGNIVYNILLIPILHGIKRSRILFKV